MTNRLLNLGCGRRFHAAWENVDSVAADPAVRVLDLREKTPYPDNSFDVVYHSHLLEHFSKPFAPVFLRECFRLLKPGGTIRVVVPDLEAIVRGYLAALEGARREEPGQSANYDWMILEMYDQAVRESTGGACNEFYKRQPISNLEFVRGRAGAEANAALEAIRREAEAEGSLRGASKWKFIFHNLGSVLRNKMAKLSLSEDDYSALQVGLFRRGGEIHQWMYDSYSLARLLADCGFKNSQKCSATESRISNWASFYLDNERDGSAYKPDSLYVEASKP